MKFKSTYKTPEEAKKVVKIIKSQLTNGTIPICVIKSPSNTRNVIGNIFNPEAKGKEVTIETIPSTDFGKEYEARIQKDSMPLFFIKTVNGKSILEDDTALIDSITVHYMHGQVIHDKTSMQPNKEALDKIKSLFNK